MRTYLIFWKAMLRQSLVGSRGYYIWLLILLFFIGLGTIGYIQQLRHGLIVTNLSDQVSWGAYISNFAFVVGIAAAAVMLVIPAYVYKLKSVKKIVLVGELLAVAAIIVALLFVVVDMGRPDRLWHILPIWGRVNWPQSMLGWDVIVLNGYLILNFHIPAYELYKKYTGHPPSDLYYKPFIVISIFWAVFLLLVEAFLYVGLGGRPHWNAAIIAPRFFTAAFSVGPAFIILTLQLLDKYTHLDVEEEVYLVLKRIVAVALLFHLILLVAEVFKEFYTDSTHGESARYLYFGLRGYNGLVPFIWTAIALNVFATLSFAIPKFSRNMTLINIAAVAAFIGIWIEKGMGLIVPGFIPTPLGDIVEYFPSWIELQICVGIWATGLLLFTLFLKAAIPIETGALRLKK